MDGVLVDNMRIHARAYDIFYERHGVGNRQNVLKELSGLGNEIGRASCRERVSVQV